MQGATLDELRDLARRSRRTLAWGLLCAAGCLLALPLVFWIADLRPALAPWAAGGAVVAGGSLLLKFAHAAGQERGAFRRLFREARVRAISRALSPEARPDEGA